MECRPRKFPIHIAIAMAHTTPRGARLVTMTFKVPCRRACVSTLLLAVLITLRAILVFLRWSALTYLGVAMICLPLVWAPH